MIQFTSSWHAIGLKRVKENQRNHSIGFLLRNVINRPGFIGGEERIWFVGNPFPRIDFSGPIINQISLPCLKKNGSYAMLLGQELLWHSDTSNYIFTFCCLSHFCMNINLSIYLLKQYTTKLSTNINNFLLTLSKAMKHALYMCNLHMF